LDAFIAQLSSTVSAARTLEQLVCPLLEMLGGATGFESACLTAVDPDSRLLSARLVHNAGALQVPGGAPMGESPFPVLMAPGQHVGAEWHEEGADDATLHPLGFQRRVQAAVRASDGRLLGTLCAASASTRPLPPDGRTVLTLLAALVAQFMERDQLATELRLAREQLSTLALTDGLTGLPNQRALFDDLQRLLQRASREGSTVLVGCIHLDGFTALQERLGVAAADLFLRAVSQRLALEMRGSDMLAHRGGASFVVVGPGVGLTGEAAPVVMDRGESLQAAATLQQRAALATVGRFDLEDGQSVQYAGAQVGVLALNPAGLTAEDALQLVDARVAELRRSREPSRPSAVEAAH